MATQKTWIPLYLLLALTLSEFQPTTPNQYRCPVYNQINGQQTIGWDDRGFCRSIDLLTGRFPYRIWEGKGHYRFLGRRNAELSCDFQQPRSIISNVIWHKVKRPRSLGYDEYEEKVLHGPFSNGILFQAYNPQRLYALNRIGGSSLFIQDVRPLDFGTYRCFATRYAIPFTYKYPQIITIYQDVEFYPKHLQYEVFEK